MEQSKKNSKTLKNAWSQQKRKYVEEPVVRGNGRKCHGEMTRQEVKRWKRTMSVENILRAELMRTKSFTSWPRKKLRGLSEKGKSG